MDSEVFQKFKNTVIERLKKFPSSPGKFSKFMLSNFELWKSMSKEMWYELYEEIRKEVSFGLYDFTYFSNSVIGINMYEEFFLKSKFSKAEFEILKCTISPKGHNQLKLKEHFSTKQIEQNTIIRRQLKKKGLNLLEVEYVRFLVEHQDDCYIMKNSNFNYEEEFATWEEKVKNDLEKENRT